MKLPEDQSEEGLPLRAWGYVALICLVGSSPDFILNRVTIPLSRSLVIGAFSVCGFWLLLAAALGFVGGRYRSWLVTLTGVVAMSVATHFGECVYDALYGITPGSPLWPNQEEMYEVLMYLGTATVVAPITHLATARLLRRRCPPGHCQNCGYDLTGNVSGVCPECGTPVVGDSGKMPSWKQR